MYYLIVCQVTWYVICKIIINNLIISSYNFLVKYKNDEKQNFKNLW